MYDFINLGKKSVNWAFNLASYNRILNEESKEELGLKSPSVGEGKENETIQEMKPKTAPKEALRSNDTRRSL